MDPIELLARDDKWYLGCGDGILFAPQCPAWLDSPGFWDEATVFQHAFAPVFTVAVLDGEGRELPMRAQSRRWTPADLTLEYRLAHGITATEVRTVQPGGIFVSEWRLRALRPVLLHLVAWTAQDASSLDRGSVSWRGVLAFQRTLRGERDDLPLAVSGELACVGETTSWGASLSEPAAIAPHWRLTPFPEQWSTDGLPRVAAIGAWDGRGVLYGAVHRAVALGNEEASATFAMRLAPVAAALAPEKEGAVLPRPAASHHGTLGGTSRRRWSELFGRVPRFRCSDPYLETYYWYRWYGVWLNAIAPGSGNYTQPATCEGIGRLHQPTAVAAPCHVRELRWARDPALARGVLRTFLTRQKDDGSLPGSVLLNELRNGDPYQANWGDAMLAVDACAPDDAFCREMYPRLSRYADWLVRTQDPDATGMIDVLDRWHETPECRSEVRARSAGSAPAAEPGRLKSVDATVYAYALFRCLQRLAPRVGAETDAERWDSLAAHTADAVRSRMWDARAEMFSDVDPIAGARTGVRSALCFYPYLTDLATAEHLGGLEHNLCDPAQFWTSFPVPTLSAEDPLFDPTGAWKGKRHASPLNGRVWPVVNSHLVEALARASIAYAPHLRVVAAQLLQRFVRMLFHDGDLERANCYEHYNPISGHASLYRGVDDHQRSWVNDLIIQYAAGVRPHASGITIDPFPLGLEMVELSGVSVRGHTIDLRIEGERVMVTVDGAAREGKLGTRMELGR